MKKFKSGATLLITTIALSIVVILASTFSGVYFRYAKMNQNFRTYDNEKVSLRNNIEVAYERFINNGNVEYLGETRALRTYLTDSSEKPAVISVAISDFIANFRVETPKVEGTFLFTLYVSKKSYKINSSISGNDTLGYSLEYINYERIDQ